MVSDMRARQIANRERYGENPELLTQEHPDVVHGKYSTYTNWGCRCAECKRAWSVYCYQSRVRRGKRQVSEDMHGTENAYGNYGCRCRPCTDAWSKATGERNRRRLARKRAEAENKN